MAEELEGTLETLTFCNEDTGYAVARLRVDGPELARRIVSRLGAEALQVIEREPRRLDRERLQAAG